MVVVRRAAHHHASTSPHSFRHTPGALAVARMLSKRFDATLVFQNFSRLVYDCNRPPESPDAMPVISEIYRIPGNEEIPPGQKQARVDEIYLPWQRTLAQTVAERMAAGRETVIVTIHTFTPVYRGVPREVEIGILVISQHCTKVLRDLHRLP